ncbi:hypothetical protein KR222_000850, partial [Zaprionus bogoriensis]
PRSDESPASGERAPCLGNPGTLVDLHRRCHDMFPQTFEGLRLSICRPVSPSVVIGHSLQLGSKSSMGDCQFSASYASNCDPLLTGEIDARGNVTASVMHFLGPRLRGKLTATLGAAKLQSTRVALDYYGDDYSCTCMLSDLSMLVASYLQQVTPHLALGVDLVYQREDMAPAGQIAMVSAVARYGRDNRMWSIALSPHTLELCYSQIYGQNLGASVQLQANMLKRQAVSRLCYQCSIPRMGFAFRGGIDTHGVISAVCERRLDPLPLLLLLSGKLNHFTSRFRFGLGVIIG